MRSSRHRGHTAQANDLALDEHLEKMRQRRETVEHSFGTIKAWMGATHFLKTLPRGCLRDGAARMGLRSDPRHEHHRHPATNGYDQRRS